MVFASSREDHSTDYSPQPILGGIGSAFPYYKSPKAKNNSLLAARSQHLGSLMPPEASE